MLNLRVDAIEWDLSDVATFYLTPISGQKVAYKAGQFITLVFSHHNHEIRRSYSLSSSPDEDRLAITIKRVSNGEISRFMLTKVQVGDIIQSTDPAGVFTVTYPDQEKDIVFFAAGSGITPVYALIKYILNRAGKSKVHLIYSNLKRSSIIFNEQLTKLSNAHSDRFNLVHLISDEANRLNNLVIEKLVMQQVVFDASVAEFYICGPFSYIRTITLTLQYMGIATGQIHKENFVLETIPVKANTANYPPRDVTINIDGTTHNITVAENQSILQAALQNNIQLPYSCRSGICSACVARCKTGQVEMTQNEVLTPQDIQNGWILTCTGHPISDDVVVGYVGRREY
ncbi:ferredoxin--NADP reductase [Mucilaginibacter pallidiroseus]|uniref:Ferredoxin--NADP reductase n=1 Tax=Mucilaginibacter pallidiroseus TaxID=2599295 RepID=A0A563UED9_9SPHI|nr:ferredoxin--NADP reductase [Mucilaginibacter pallidiroseus]TWR29720.1 ferredoxin--NADP reductase [Mucilaginibacter pallidiroseus]